MFHRLTAQVALVQEHVRAAHAAATERGVQNAACTAALGAHRHAPEDGQPAANPGCQPQGRKGCNAPAQPGVPARQQVPQS